MTVKKARVSKEQAAAASMNPVEFVGEVKGEMNKITWTSSDELRTYTKIVVACTFLFGVSIYLMDVVIQNVLFVLNWIVGGGL